MSIEKVLRKFNRAHWQVPIAIAALVILGCLMLGSSAVAWRASNVQQQAQRWHLHTLEVLLAADAMEIGVLNVSRGERGYLLTGRRLFLTPYRSGSQAAVRSIDSLDALTADDPAQQRRVARLRRKTAYYLEIAEHVTALLNQGRAAEAMTIAKSDRRTGAVHSIVTTLGEIRATERARADRRWQQAVVSTRTNKAVLASVAAAGIFVLIFATLAVIALRAAFRREAAYRRELRRLADTDELTGLANRRELMNALERAISGARRGDGQLAFALIDIDHFKLVNDTHGHPAGDEVIRKIARAALAAVRGCDIVGRLGGEEFAIVLPGAGVAAAYTVCERLRERIHGEIIELPEGACVQVTISSGVARLGRDDTAESLIERADAALYSAKHDGRDQVRLAA